MSRHRYDYIPKDKNQAWVPERNLLAKIVNRALADILESEETSRDALNWFTSMSKEPRCFLWICHWLDYDPIVFRRRAIMVKKERDGRGKLNFREKREILLKFGYI